MSGNNIDKSIFQWITENQKVNEDIEGAKYAKLIEYLGQYNASDLHQKSSLNVLVVGGGESRVELQIISQLGLSGISLYSLDIVEPKVKVGDVINNIVWIPELCSADSRFTCKFDILLCLGASRYFPKAINQYSSLLKFLKKESLVVIDFHSVPPIRQAVTHIMGNWLRQSWQESQEKTVTRLVELASVSRSLSEQLKGLRVSFSEDANDVGIKAGEFGLQQFIYESIYPFWFREGFTDVEVAAQLAWSFMCTSCDNSLDKIKQFAQLNSLVIKDVFDIYSDTHVLIARCEA